MHQSYIFNMFQRPSCDNLNCISFNVVQMMALGLLSTVTFIIIYFYNISHPPCTTTVFFFSLDSGIFYISIENEENFYSGKVALLNTLQFEFVVFKVTSIRCNREGQYSFCSPRNTFISIHW